MKATTKLALLSAGQFLCIASFVLLGLYQFRHYQGVDQEYKKQCFDKFDSIEYEIILDELYCEVDGKAVKHKTNP